MTQIIALSGFAGSGKDEAARALVEAGFERVAFADVLRDIAYAIDPYVYDVSPADTDDGVRFSRLSEVIDTNGWDWSKNNLPDVRRLLQRLGTEAGRDILGENIWVDTALNRVQSDKVVVTDCRFLNEVRAVRDRGGIVVRIERPGVGPRNDHPSETELIGAEFDAVLHNDGTIEQLHDRIRALAGV